MDPTEICDRIQAAMDYAKLNQTELRIRLERQKHIKLTKSAVSQWLKPGSGMTPKNVFAVAEVTGCSARYLATGEGTLIEPSRPIDNLDQIEAWLVRAFRSCTPEAKKMIVSVLESGSGMPPPSYGQQQSVG